MSNRKIFIISLAAILGLEILSFLGNLYPAVDTVLFFIIVLAALALSLFDLKYGLYLLVVDLVVDSFGYWFSAFPKTHNFSLRIGLFAVIMLAWAYRAFRDRKIALLSWKLSKWYFALAGAVIIGIVAAVLNGNERANIFFDVHKWFYFGLVLPISQAFQDKRSDYKSFWGGLQMALLAALSASVFKSFLLLYVFSHNFTKLLPPLYKWVRDTRVGEITRVGQNFFRIFFQSHVYSALVSVPLLGYLAYSLASAKSSKTNPWATLREKKTLSVLTIALFTEALISFSRSFWFGMLGGLVFLAIYFAAKKMKKELLFLVLGAFVSAISAAILMFVIVKFPLPPVKSDYSLFKSLQERFRLSGEAAVSSRWQLLGPLWSAIASAPPKGLGLIWGKGFGSTVTYKTLDPTVLIANPEGWLTTYAFEWGWLDIWLKIGLLGLIIYAGFLISIIKSSLMMGGAFGPMLGAAVVILAVINFFTPYLNHPLGIGFLLFVSAYLETSRLGDKPVS